MAGLFGYSKWHFCAKFHDYTGKTFTKYVRHYRLSLAALDILAGKKVTDVAMRYSYETLGGFNKAFLAEYGCLPREYRKHAKEAQLYYERRKLTMYTLTNRCETLRSLAVNENCYEDRYCMQHRVFFHLGMIPEAENKQPNGKCIAAGICNVLERFSPVILPGELITGFNFADDGTYTERFAPEDTPENRVLAAKNGILPEEMETYFSKMRDDRWRIRPEYPALTQLELDAKTEWAAMGRCIDANHTVLGYEQVLKLGFRGLLERVKAWEAENGDPTFYEPIRNICQSACKMGKKYAEAARRIMEAGDPMYQQEDLEHIIRVCSNVPENPAASFAEAVQSLWFAHIINTWEDHINANSLGRLDQILYPYYKADVEQGILTKEEAFDTDF